MVRQLFELVLLEEIQAWMGGRQIMAGLSTGAAVRAMGVNLSAVPTGVLWVSLFENQAVAEGQMTPQATLPSQSSFEEEAESSAQQSWDSCRCTDVAALFAVLFIVVIVGDRAGVSASVAVIVAGAATTS